MKAHTVVIQKDVETGLFVGYVPGIAGAHSQGETLEGLWVNLEEVMKMLAEEVSL